MSRLIDADALEQEIIKEYYTANNPSGILTRKGEEIFNAAIDVARCRVRDADAIDAVPVVRCRECKHHRDQLDDRFVICRCWKKIMEVDWFCHKGAKMDGGAEA